MSSFRELGIVYHKNRVDNLYVRRLYVLRPTSGLLPASNGLSGASFVTDEGAKCDQAIMQADTANGYMLHPNILLHNQRIKKDYLKGPLQLLNGLY